MIGGGNGNPLADRGYTGRGVHALDSASHDDRVGCAPAFDATTGLLAIASGIAQAAWAHPGKDASGEVAIASPSIRLRPMLLDQGTRALAVQLRF